MWPRDLYITRLRFVVQESRDHTPRSSKSRIEVYILFYCDLQELHTRSVQCWAFSRQHVVIECSIIVEQYAVYNTGREHMCGASDLPMQVTINHIMQTRT